MIILGSDHGGFELKKEIISHLEEKGIEYIDCGCKDTNSCDYPDYAKIVCEKVLTTDNSKGILVCGTGIGMSIAANKIRGIRCALCSDCFSAKATRQHNDTNVLALGGRVLGPSLANEIVDIFIETDFSNENRHIRRISMLEG